MSYYGPAFAGIKKDFKAHTLKKPDIACTITDSLREFNRKHDRVIPEIRTASRTDVGVHATRNAFTFNATQESQHIQTDSFLLGTNNYMYQRQLPLRIVSIHKLVDSNFDCRRWANMRTYMYKRAE